MELSDNPSSVPSGSEFEPEGGENVDGSLKEINELTGRKYSSLDEAKKAIKETYKFVGGLGEIKKKAAAFDELQTAKKTFDQSAKEQKDKVDRLELLYEVPNLKDYPDVADLILEGARNRNKKPSEFFLESPLRGFIEKEMKEKEAKNPSFTTSGQRLTPGETGITSEDFSKLSLEEQKKIISKMPGWSDTIPAGQYSSLPRNQQR